MLGASPRQPACVTILVAMGPSTLSVLVTVQEGVNCSSTRRHILYFHPWVHMLNVILAVVHVCLRHFTHYISCGETCVLVASHPDNSQYYVEYNRAMLAQEEEFLRVALQFNLDLTFLG